MSTIPTTEIISRPPANETLPPGHIWKTHVSRKRMNPPRRYAPKTKLGDFVHLS